MSASIKEKRLVSARRTSRRPSVSIWSNSSITPRRSVSLQWNQLARIRPSSQPKTHETRRLPTADQWAEARSLLPSNESAMPRRLVDSRGLAPLRGALAARSAPWTPLPATTSGRQSSPLSVLDYHAEMPAGAPGARAHLSIRHGVERAEPAARVPIACCAHPITRPVPTRLEDIPLRLAH